MPPPSRTPRVGRRRIELLLDALLLLLLLLLFAPRLTGLGPHEWIGLAFVPPTVVHILVSWRWLADSTRRLAHPDSARLRVNYLLNALLFVLLTLVIGSGIAISEVAVPALGIATIDDRSWRALHNLSLNWLLLAAGFHIAMNWSWVRRTLASLRSRDATAVPVRIAPAAWIGSRTLVLLTAASVIVGAAVAWLGVPSERRRYAMSEVERFAGSGWHGWVQLGGETLLLGVAAYVGRKALRLRL